MMTGKCVNIESRMDFSYEFLLKVIHSQNYTYRQIVSSSFYAYQNNKAIEVINDENNDLLNHQNLLKIDEYLDELKFKRDLEIKFKLGDKKCQKLIGQWNNTHVGPKWANAIKKFNEYIKYQNTIDSNIKIIEQLSYNPVFENLEFLRQYDFIDSNNQLTKRGLIATEINEMDSLLISEAYCYGFFDKLNEVEILCIMSLFHPIKCNSDIMIIDTPKNMVEHYNNLKNLKMYKHEIFNGTLSMNCVIDWMKGDEIETICCNYEVFPGNLLRIILGLLNSIDEMTNVCILTENVIMLEKLNNAKQMLVRNDTINDSLYLRL